MDAQGVATENVVALCDVDEERAAESFLAFPRARRYKDFRVMLEKEKGIDAVTVSTPDHTHAVASMAAMELGKHVFCQKPLAHSLEEVRVMREAARKYGVATQMGIQGHCSEGVRRLREWIEAGVIGTVREVHYWTNRPVWPQAIERPLEQFHVPRTLDWDLWLGPAPERPYHPAYVPFKWRGWWDFGTGALTNGQMQVVNGANTWDAEFSGTFSAGTFSALLDAGSTVDNGTTTNAAQGSVDGSFTEDAAGILGIGGVFDFEQVGLPTTYVEGVFLAQEDRRFVAGELARLDRVGIAVFDDGPGGLGPFIGQASDGASGSPIIFDIANDEVLRQGAALVVVASLNTDTTLGAAFPVS